MYVPSHGEITSDISELIKINRDKMNEIIDFIGVKVKDNTIVGATISFFEKNADKIQDKDPKEIFDSIRKSMKAKK